MGSTMPEGCFRMIFGRHTHLPCCMPAIPAARRSYQMPGLAVHLLGYIMHSFLQTVDKLEPMAGIARRNTFPKIALAEDFTASEDQ